MLPAGKRLDGEPVESRDRSPWLIAALALGAMLSPFARTAPSGAEPEEPAAAPRVEAQPPARSSGSGPAPADDCGIELPADCGDPLCHVRPYFPPDAEAFFDAPRASEAEVLVAMLPDPLDSALDDHFDQAVDTLVRAVEALGYVRYRHWLPWRPQNEGQDGSVEAPLDGARCHRSRPGVLLFRSTERAQPGGEERRPLVLLLVGETPVWGVHEPALARALSIASVGANPTIDVVGPYFSGSVFSLSGALCRSPPELVSRARFITGSATNPENRDRLEAALRGCHGRSLELSEDFYQTTVLPDDVLEQLFYDYLEEHEGVACLATRDDGKEVKCPDDADSEKVTDQRLLGVALLTESSTTYGAAFATESNERSPEHVITFPAHISRVRSELEREGSRRASAEQTAPLPSERETLEYSLREQAESADSIAAFSTKTPIIVDLQLANLLGGICRDGVRFVGIVATDAADRLFLARRVRAHCPDARLFAFESEVSYTHHDYAREFEGMLAIASQPLAPRSWPGKAIAPRPFSSSLGIGTYNATLIARGATRGLMHYGLPEEPSGRPTGAWLMTVGRGSFWPMAFLGPMSGAQLPEHLARVESRPERDSKSIDWRVPVPNSAMVLFGLIAAAGLYLSVSCSRALAPDTRPSFGLRWLVPCADAWSRFATGAAAAIAFGALLSPWALGAYLVAIWQALSLRSSQDSTDLAAIWDSMGSALVGIIMIGIPILVVLAADRIARGAYGRHERDTIGRTLVRLPLLALVTVGISAWLAGWVGAQQHPLDRRLDFLRLAWVTNRVSIVIPAVYLAVATFLFAAAQANRVTWGAQLRAPLSGHGLGQAHERIRRVLGLGPVILPGAFAIALLVACFVLRVDTLEGYRWDFVFGSVGVLLTLLVASSIGWFWSLSCALDDLLRRLASTPLASAFKHLPAHYARRLGGRIFGRAPFASELAVPLRRLERAIELEEGGAHRSHLEEVSKLRDEVASLERDREALGTQCFERFSALARRLEPWLEEVGRGPRGPMRQALEGFFSVRVAIYVFNVQMQLRNLLFSATAGMLLVLLAFASHPFQPRSAILLGLTILVFAGVSVAYLAFVKMEKNEILSYMGGTTAGRVSVDRTFFGYVLTYVVLPLLGLVAAQFPEIGDAVYAWLNPATKGLL